MSSFTRDSEGMLSVGGLRLADIAAKCGYGFMIYAIARSKMESEGVSLETMQPAAAGAA